MRKNIFKHFRIVAVVAIIILPLIACGGGAGGDSSDIPVRVRAYDNSQPQRRSIARSGMGLMRSSGFSEYDAFYTWLENNLEPPQQITPTKFVLSGNFAFVDSEGYFERPSFNHFDIDFSKPGGYTVDIGDIPTDITCSAIAFTLNPYGGAIEFAWPGGQAAFDKSWNRDKPCTVGGIVTLMIGDLDPYAARWFADFFALNISRSSPPDNITQPLRTIAYGAGTDRRYSNDYEIYSWELAGLGSNPGHFVMLEGPYVFIPLTPVTIPSSASSVTIHVSWDLNGIISYYKDNVEGHDSVQYFDGLNFQKYVGDIVVLKNGWWGGLEISITVQ